MEISKPWLSIVMAARNDNYGGDFLARLENSVKWLHAWNRTLQIPLEFVIVNYNPVSENPPLEDSVDWPVANSDFRIRILSVPAETHQFYVNPSVRKTVPLFEFIAKNIGIRAAKGDYILCTNADILPDPGVLFSLKMRKLSVDNYYRADRADFRKILQFDFGNPLKTLLEIRKNVFRIFLKGYSYDFDENAFSLYGLYRKRIGNKLKIWKDFQLLKVEKFANRFSIPLLYENLAQKYHLHASGDFMLMHRNNWFRLRGYPENCFASVHTDSLFTIQAAVSGLKERILSAPVYHQDHERPDAHHLKEDKDFLKMYERLVEEGCRMDNTKQPIFYNDENWGAGNFAFEEKQIGKR